MAKKINSNWGENSSLDSTGVIPVSPLKSGEGNLYTMQGDASEEINWSDLGKGVSLADAPNYAPLTTNVGDLFQDESQYDSSINWDNIQQVYKGERSLEDVRAERQPWYDQFSNNVVNLSVIAATTFASSYAGVAAGIVNMVFNPYDDGETNLNWGERQLDKFVNDPVSLWLNSINKWTKKNFPTYGTDEYKANLANGDWWKNMGTSQFWGEGLFENAGFTLGMAASGKLAGNLLGKITKTGEQVNIVKNGINKAIQNGTLEGNVDDILKKVLSHKQDLRAIDLTGEMAQAVKNINQSGFINRGIAGAFAVAGEARQEGINSSLETYERDMESLNSPEGQMELTTKTAYELFSNPDNDYMFKSQIFKGNILDNIKPEYLETFQTEVDKNKQLAEVAINDRRARVAGMDFAINFPVLYASSIWQFGRTFTKGYDTQRGLIKNLKSAVRQPVNSLKLKGAGRLNKVDGKYVVNNSFTTKLKSGAMVASNPLVEANEEMLQASAQTASEMWAGSKMNSFLGYKLDPKAEQEEIGALNAVFNGIVDTYSDFSNYQEGFAGLIMGGMGSLNFTFSKNQQGKRPLFEGGVWQDYRDAKQETQDLQDIAEKINNRLETPEYKNYYQGTIRHNSLEENKEQALEAGDKFSFLNSDHAQFISDLTMFEKAGKLQDFEDYINNNIENYNTSDPIRISELASEIREASKDVKTGEDVLKHKSDETLVKEALKWNQELSENTKNYRDIVNNLNSLLGSTFEDEDEFNEMVYLFSQIQNFEGRFDNVQQEIRDELNNLKSRGLNFKKFTINLQGSEKSLTLAEIANQATPDELRSFIYGREDEEGNFYKGDEYINSLLIEGVLKKKGLLKKGKLEVKAEQFEELLKSITPKAYSISQKFIDLAKIEDARAKLVNTYNKYVSQPQALRDKLSSEVKKAADAQENIINSDVKELLKEASSISEVRDLVKEEEAKGTNIDKILSEMSLSDNPDYNSTVEEYKRMEDLSRELEDSQTFKNAPEGIKRGARQLFNRLKNKATSFDELSNPVISTSDLESLGDRINHYNEEELESIKETLKNALSELKNNEDRYKAFTKKLEAAPAKTEQSPPDAEDTPPVGVISPNEVKAENKLVASKLDAINDKPVTNTQWNSGTHEISIDTYKDTGVIKDNDHPIYKPAVRFLQAQGAFEYVNSGKMTKGKKVHFMALDSYWDELVRYGSDPDWVEQNNPLLLVVEDTKGNINYNGKRYQIVGTFNKQNNPALHAKVLSEFNKGGNIYVSEEFTTVNNVTPGRLEFNDDKSLKSLGNPKERPILLGIATDTGQLDTNLGSDSEVLNITPTNNDYSNSGRLYLLTKSARDGEHIPTAVRVKTLDAVDTSIDTPLFNELKKAIDKVAEAAITVNDASVGKAVHDLRNILYVGSKAKIPIVLRSETQANVTNHSLIITKGTEVKIIPIARTEIVPNEANDGGWETQYTTVDVVELASDILQALKEIKAPFQINKNTINGKWNVRPSLDYNEVLLEAGILTTNLKENSVRGAYFTMNPLDSNFKETTVEKVLPKTSNVAPSTLSNNTSSISGNTIKSPRYGEFTINERGEVKNSKGVTVTNPDIVTEVKVLNYMQSLTPEQLEEITFYGKDVYEGVFSFASKNTFYVMPSGQIWNGVTLTSNNSPLAKDIEAYKATKSKPVEQASSTSASIDETISQSEEEVIVKEISLTGILGDVAEPTREPAPKAERKRPKKGNVSGSVILGNTTQNLTPEEIQAKIDEHKDYQKDNCNGIIK